MMPAQLGWTSWRLFVNYNAVLPKMAVYLRQQGRSMPLEAQDLRMQMSRLAYFVMPKVNCAWKQRFGRGAATSNCWCIELDKHSMGYRLAADEDVQEAYYDEFGQQRAHPADPRQGELYELVEAVDRAIREESQQTE